MAKYSFELKMKIIKDSISGEGGYKYLAKKYNIAGGVKGEAQVKRWVNTYQKFGEEGLFRKRKKKLTLFK